MTDKQLIKQEIEKRIKNLEFSLENNCVEKYSKLDILGNITTLESLLQFLESIPEEPKCIYNRTLEERKKFCKYCSAACDVRIEEEPTSEDLIEEIDKIWKTCNPIDEGMGVETANIHIEQFGDIAHHFAEWQEKKMLGIAEAFYQQGRYEQEQEMMKDVVDGEYWIGEIHLDTPIIQGYDDGDRIKFIPIKTEQQ